MNDADRTSIHEAMEQQSISTHTPPHTHIKTDKQTWLITLPCFISRWTTQTELASMRRWNSRVSPPTHTRTDMTDNITLLVSDEWRRQDQYPRGDGTTEYPPPTHTHRDRTDNITLLVWLTDERCRQNEHPRGDGTAEHIYLQGGDCDVTAGTVLHHCGRKPDRWKIRPITHLLGKRKCFLFFFPLVMSPLSFKASVGSLGGGLCVTRSQDSPLVPHLLTSWWPA